MNAADLLAVVLPMALGCLLWVALLGRPRGVPAWSACLGAGYLLGAVGWGVGLRAASAIPLHAWFGQLAPWMGVVLGMGLVGLWRWRARMPRVCAPRAVPAAWPAAEGGLVVLWLILLGVHALLLTVQAISQPTLAWDAWNAWMAKSKAWVGADALLPINGFDAWWQSASGSSLYVLAGHYPEAIPRYVSWLASAHGGWSEPVVNMAWPLAWLALGAVLFGYLRLAGARSALALAACYAVLSLPLINAHVALAGYADLWLAAMLLLAIVHGERALRLRCRREAAMALLCAALLPAIKLEGAIWLLCLLLAAVTVVVPRRWQRWIVPMLVLAVLASLPFGGLHLPLPGLGTVGIGWGKISIPAMGTLDLYWRPVLDEVLDALFVLPNWHLLWYLLPAALWFRLGQARAQPALRPGLYFLGLGYAFLIVLFFFTDAAAWAENLTSVNRVLLQIVPATVFWISLLYLQVPAVRGRWS